jgi:hypothetical protein
MEKILSMIRAFIKSRNENQIIVYKYRVVESLVRGSIVRTRNLRSGEGADRAWGGFGHRNFYGL